MRFQTDCDVIFFVSSSGHCNFSCRYCIIDPIAKNRPSLDYQDVKFLLETFDNKKAFLAFSGLGDFFSGYRKTERFLSNVLEHHVEIVLDINGSILNEFPELSDDKRSKIRAVNLTMHYHQIKEKGILSKWSENARTVLEMNSDIVTPDYVLSPPLRDEWIEAVTYYEREVFARTGKKMLVVRDINRAFNQEDEEILNRISHTFAHVISGQHQEDFAGIFAGKEEVICPAGKAYFRIWNDGRVQGCPNLPEVAELSTNGNIKERNLRINADAFFCTTPRFCDCHVIEGLGKMGYAKAAHPSGSKAREI